MQRVEEANCELSRCARLKKKNKPPRTFVLLLASRKHLSTHFSPALTSYLGRVMPMDALIEPSAARMDDSIFLGYFNDTCVYICIFRVFDACIICS